MDANKQKALDLALGQIEKAFGKEAICKLGGGGVKNVEAEHLFSVPEGKDGEFVSPAFKAEDEIRVCVHPKEAIDWWRMEFMVFDGKIVFRGNDGDQERVKGQTGQKLYLNFTEGTGSIK